MAEKFILDACCGGRMMWFNKNHANTIYMDNRILPKGHKQKGFNNTNFEIKPDILGDFRDMPFKNDSFRLIVLDFPHLKSLGETSIMKVKYGCLNKETWPFDISKAFNEAWRCLKDFGVLVIKWNDKEIPYKKLLSLFDKSPLFMNVQNGLSNNKNKNKTYWFIFMKIPDEV